MIDTSMTLLNRDQLRAQILNNEQAYCDAVNWMGAKAQEEGKHTYTESGKLWHKNASELTRDGYFEKYLDFVQTSSANRSNQ